METVSGRVTIKWVDSRMMVGVDSKGHSMTVGFGRHREPEWQGAKPSDLLLLAAASCPAYDVVTILEKQREPIEGLEIICTGEQESEPPYTFTSIHLHYIIVGQVSAQKAKKAIELSEEKYCSVLSTLKPVLEITSDFRIVDQNPSKR
jgi:putative redox protein